MITPSNAQLGEVIYQLLNAPSLEQVHHLLQTYPWLTSPEVDNKLTQVIANKRREKQLPSVAVYTAARGLLRRCQLVGIGMALKTQPGWPLSTQGPLTQLLALDETAPFDLWIKRANAALKDVEPETEPDIYGLILGLSYQAEADAGLNETLIPAIERFEVAAPTWEVKHSLVDIEFIERLQHNLGHFYLYRPSGDRSQNIEKALSWLQQAQKLAEIGSAEHIDVLILMGNTYIGRIKDERLTNLEQAIACYEEAHHLAEDYKHKKRLGEIEHNLAVAYRVRLQGRRADNYEQAREWAEKALARFKQQTHPEEWARTTAELAVIYAHRQRGSRAANLEQAIEYAERSLHVYRANTHPRQWALVQLNLGNLLCDRVSGSLLDNHRRAIACFEAVLNQRKRDSNPLGWAEAMNNLGTAYAALSTSPYDVNYRQAIACFRQALEVYQPETLPAEARRTAANWGNLAFRFGQWREALDVFQIALAAGESLYQVSGTESGRRVELAESAGLTAKATFCLLRLNQFDKALLQLEQGKTRLLAEALALGDADLAILPETQRQAVEAARQEVHKLEVEMRLQPDTPARRSDVKLAEKLGQARTNLKQIIADIRQTNADFMPTGLGQLDDLLRLIPEGGALIAPLVTPQGSAVFVLPHGVQRIGTGHLIWLDTFTEGDLNALLIGSESKPGWLYAYRTWQKGGSFEGWQAAIETFTSQLWDKLIGPIHDRLVALGLVEGAPIILMPPGGLGLLPLHAAWREVNRVKRAFLDDYTITYAPSGYALSASQRRSHEPQRQQRSLLAVINPTGDLPFTPVEGEAIAALFDPMLRQALVEDHATPQAVTQAVTGQIYLHFSCHGLYDWDEVMRSGLQLAGGESGTALTLAEIISNLDLSAVRLVTLSACETGLTEFQQTPDEYIGLPAGFLQAGAPGVVSTLWAVNDLSTALLIERFYLYHLQGDPVHPDERPLSPAQALRQAQKWLRDELTLAEVNSYVERQKRRAWGHDWGLFGSLETIQRSLLAQYGHNEIVQPFAHPYYWAAFTFVGA